MEVDEGEVEDWIRMQRRRGEGDFDLVFRVTARRPLDRDQAEVIGPARRPGAVETASVVDGQVGLELARPGQDVGLVDPVFDDPPELGVARAPAPGLPHRSKSKLQPLPCPPPAGGEGTYDMGGRREGTWPNRLRVSLASGSTTRCRAGRACERGWRGRG